MALYKHSKYMGTSDSDAFDADHKPGMKVPNSGIYRCKNCGDEVASNKGDPLPPQNHHQHKPPSPIIWQLLVFAQQKK